MATIRVLNREGTIDALPELCEVLAACVNGGASVGFMLPFSPQDAEPFWRSVAETTGEGATIHVAAEVDGKVVGTVQVGLASKPNQPHRGDLMKLRAPIRTRPRTCPYAHAKGGGGGGKTWPYPSGSGYGHG